MELENIIADTNATYHVNSLLRNVHNIKINWDRNSSVIARGWVGWEYRVTAN